MRRHERTDRSNGRSRILTAGVLGGVVAAVAAGCGGGDETVESLEISDAWARPTPGGATNGAIYLSVISPIDDVLEAVSVPPEIAQEVTLHETVEIAGDEHDMGDMHADDDGMDMLDMTGMEMLDSVSLPSDETVSFQPAGLHIMLEGLGEPLLEGQRFTATLTFASAGPHDVEIAVTDDGPSSPS